MGKEYFKIVNGPLMFMLCAIVILYVLLQSMYFMRKAWKRGEELGMTVESRMKVLMNSAVFSIIPSIPIVLFLLALMPVLGNYFPWLRLSVIGSGMYENMAADATAKAFGLKTFTDEGFTSGMFISAMWVMTISITYGLFFIVFGLRKYQNSIKNSRSKNQALMGVMMSALFLGMMANFVGPYFAGPIINFQIGLLPLLVFLVSCCTFLLMSFCSKTFKIKSLDDFSMPICLLVGMASAVVLAPMMPGA